MTYFTDVTDAALQRIDEIGTQASDWADATLTRMDTLADEAQSLLDVLNGVLYSPDWTDNLLYVGPDAPVEPDYSASAPADPTINPLAAIADFSYSDTPYTDLVKDEVQAVLTSVLGGNIVLTNTIWTSIWDRVVADFAIQQTGEEWAASNLGASLGWELPTEATLSRLDKAQDDTSKRASVARLEKAIQEAVQRREDYWNSVQRGNEFETLWINEHTQTEGRKLATASALVEAQIKIQQLLLQENTTNVTIYLAKWDGILKEVQATASMLQARTGAVSVQVDSERTRHAFEATRVEKALKAEDGTVGLEVSRARLVVENAIGVLTQLATLASGMAQAALSASDVSVGTGTSMSVDENYSGEI